MDDDVRAQSVPQQIKTRCLNKTLGQWIRALDMIIAEYSPLGGTIEEEAEHVTKLAVLLMLTRWFDEQDICLLLDTSKLRLPKRLAKTDKHSLAKILDRPPSGSGMIEDFTDPDPHEMPGNRGVDDGPSFLPPY